MLEMEENKPKTEIAEMKNLMSFKRAAFGLLLGALPLAGISQNAAGNEAASKAIIDFEATVEVDKGMVITSPGSGFDTLVVDISFSGTFDTAAENEFVVMLSDPQGSFMQNTTEVIRLAEAEDTVYNWVVPTTVADGDLYRVGVRSTLLDSVVGQSLQFRIKYEYAAEKQIPNSGFEVWMNEGETVAEPVGWHSFKTAGGDLSTMGGDQLHESSDVRPGSLGSRSAKINSKQILGIPANGNLTTGRINMGSMTAADITGNYNFTDLTDPAHALPFTTVPDSLTFWVKFMMTDKLYQSTGLFQGFYVTDSSDMYAALTVTIHDGDTSYQDPNVDSLKQGMETHVVAKAQQLFPDTKGEWVRYSVPFEPGMSDRPEYILVSLTTNINPGMGPGSTATKADTIWLDDMLMIYNPTVSIALEKNDISFGRTSIGFNAVLDGTFNPSNLAFADSNLLIVEADTLNDFSTAQVLYSQKQGEGSVSGDLDLSELKIGKTYYVRARTTNYAAVSTTITMHMLDERTEFAVNYSVEGSEEASVKVYRNNDADSLAVGTIVDIYDSLTFIVSYPEDEKFLGWYENGILLASTDTVTVGSVMRDYALTARLAPRYYSLEISGVSEQAGSVLVCYAGSGDTVADLDRIEVPADLTLTAIPAQYRVLEGFYTADSVLIGRTSPLAFHMAGDTAVHVRFARQTGALTIELEGIDYVENYVVTYAESGDTLTDLKAIELPAELSLSATAVSGGHVEGVYTEDGQLLSATVPFNFTMVKDTVFSIRFARNPADSATLEVVIPVSGLNSWDVVYAGTDQSVFEEGNDPVKLEVPVELTISAVPESGYLFDGFYAVPDNALMSATTPYTFTLTKDTVIQIYVKPDVANESSDAFRVRVYPNPVKDQLHVEGRNLDRIEIFNMMGAKVMEAELEAGSGLPQIQRLPEGMYIYKVYNTMQDVVVGRIVKL